MIVAKFGGTSVADASAIRRVVEIVRGRARDEQVVVVVSAFAGVTDELLAAGELAASGQLKSALDKMAGLRARTMDIASDLLSDAATTVQTSGARSPSYGPQSRKGAIQRQSPAMWDVEALLAKLEEMLRGADALREFSPRTSDAVAATGELISSRLIAAAMERADVSAEFVDARKAIVTTGVATRAWPLLTDTASALQQKVVPVLERGAVPVLGGFIGATVNGVTTTLGRGGSDFSAAVIARCLGAERVELWTDVDGVMTCDPRICPDARTLDEISFEEAAQLAWFGAKVVHPATLIPALERDIPVHVLNSFNPGGGSTRITRTVARNAHRAKAIAAKKGISVIRVSGDRSPDARRFLEGVSRTLERNGLQAELVCSAENSVSVAVAVDVLDDVKRELARLGTVEHEAGAAIVCIVGEELFGAPRVMARIFDAVGDARVRMISQGASSSSVALAVDEAHANSLVRRIHSALFGESEMTAVALGAEQNSQSHAQRTV